MTNYYPLVVRGIANLKENNAESRRALYERVQAALVEQLRLLDPPLDEPDILRERLCLEDAVRRVEADAATPTASRSGATRAARQPSRRMRIADTEGAALATEIDAPNLVPNGERDAPHEPRWRAPSRPAKAAPRGGRLLHWVALVTAWFVVLTTVALGLVLYWQRQQVKAWLGARPAAGWQRVVAPSPPKISDRLGPGQQAADAASAQRASLYEEDPGEREGKRHDGTVIWRTETLSPERQPPELAIRAELEIPERHLRMTLLLHRNTDKALPASHTLEIAFQPPGNFGEISSIPALLMKSAELSDGSRLAGVTARVTSGLFLIGLSAADGQIQRNLQMLKELTWFDIPIVYENGRRAILAIEKGAPGERAFQEAFMAWSAAPANPARQ